MAKQYRKPTNEVTVIYGGRSPAGRDTLNPKDVLPNGMTAKQHCEKLIAERGGKGRFIEKNSELEDVCMLHSCSYFGGCYEAAEYSYHYALCTEIEFTATLNGKATTAKELAALQGGERVIITANQDVTWSANDNKKLEKVAINSTTYSFTMPKAGSFTLKATGKCDPKASKSVVVAVKTATTQTPPKMDIAAIKLNHALTFTGGLITGMDDAQTRAYAANIAQTESSFVQKQDNKKGYYGFYQFGAAAFAESGLIDRAKYDAAVKVHGTKISNGSHAATHIAFIKDKNNWVSGYSLEKFLNDKDLQHKSFVKFTNNNIKYASSEARKIMTSSAEKTAAYLKMAHLKGPIPASKAIVNPQFDDTDGNGTSMRKYGEGVATELNKYTKIVREALKNKNGGKS
ncbi:hypothetical protein [Wielerella bovis]|uniref:hypothetical protein n=2 Tax=Wielerella bovis TaxID=2917790 RepID=UPI00201A099F|nr:hypothetical protein [Wielerella bovis]ULJ66475.1 hypothetical protein MIS31_09475 [Wielerella bovis]